MAFATTLDVGIHMFADGCHFVDERNFDGQKRVGGVLDHFGRRNVCDDKWCFDEVQRSIEVFHNRDRFCAIRPDDDAVGSHEIFDGRAFSQKFRIRDDVESIPARLIGPDDFA